MADTPDPHRPEADDVVHGPDYDMKGRLDVDGEQLKALGHALRSDVISLLGQRAATTSQLAEALDTPVGTVGHHLGVLEEAGLVRVVRTRQVRGITAKYYGRTAAVFMFDDRPDDGDVDVDVDAWREEALPDPHLVLSTTGAVGTVRFARVPEHRHAEWVERMVALSGEFATQPEDGDVVYALSLQLYPTTRRPLPLDEDAQATDDDTDDR